VLLSILCENNNPKQAIPNEFAYTHLHRMEGRNVTLFVDQDRTWNVDLKLTINKQFRLTSGWSKFRADNNLKFGDVCVFMLNKCKGTVSFQVVIFSLEKDMRAPYFPGNLFTCQVATVLFITSLRCFHIKIFFWLDL
jgi:hypothetical protein